MDSTEAPVTRISPYRVFVIFSQISLSGFGGAMFWARRRLVDREHWLTDREFVEFLTLGQLLPGPPGLNLTVLVGYRFGGWAGAVAAVNTHDRLEQAGHSGEVSDQGARDLRDALEFLGKLRITHQTHRIARGQEPDNFLALEELSNLERSHLKSAFAVVQSLQNVLAQRYGGGRLG